MRFNPLLAFIMTAMTILPAHAVTKQQLIDQLTTSYFYGHMCTDSVDSAAIKSQIPRIEASIAKKEGRKVSITRQKTLAPYIQKLVTRIANMAPSQISEECGRLEFDRLRAKGLAE